VELILIPILASLIWAFLPIKSRWIASGLSLIGLVVLLTKYNQGSFPDGLVVFDQPWLGESVRFTMVIDQITWFMLLLTQLLLPIIVLSVKDQNQKLIAWAFLMQAGLNGVFMAQDGLIFYLFWELAMIPIYFITLEFSEKDNFVTTIRFFIYTFVGSLAMLASLIYLASLSGGSFAYADLLNTQLSHAQSLIIGGGLLLAFAVKIPIFPFHLWQADTYTNAPAQGSMLLSGIMLKMGLYGLIRWYMPLAAESIDFYQPIVMTLAVIGIIYGGIIAIRQDDMKRITAYSSLSHVGLIAAGFFTLNASGFNGGLLQMLVHGLNVVGMFLIIDIIQKNANTRNLSELGGIASKFKFFTVLFFIIVIGTAAAPLTSGFPGEFMLLNSVFKYNSIHGLLSGLTIILCAVYMLRIFQKAALGSNEIAMSEISFVDYLPLIIVAFTVLFIGLFPQVILEIFPLSVEKLMLEISNAKGVLS
jgi:NADH-quinone oxidoreductase subunit M